MEKTNQYLSLGHYSPLTIRNYLGELRFLFVYYGDVDPLDFTEAMIMQYLLYLSKTPGCSRVKCRMAAQSISFFMRHVAKRPYVIPTVIYPRPANKLPAVMLPEEIMKLLDSIENIKHRTILMLLYSTGMRVSEIANCTIADIDSKNMRIKIVQGKGCKDRFTILSQQVLLELRAYYLIYKPKEYLFNGYRPGKRYSVRSIQHLMQKALTKVGLENKNYTIHTIRHSFATHLLDNGTDLHTIKELLGHSSLQTTTRYMHLSAKRIDGIFNPYDALLLAKDNNIINQNLK
ncbi:MAG: tyrosine-type recombinase/integrase [Segetibacter sp.]|nr:tyrosine-type recombinase/integrase [Segetibacter sp.]